MKYIKKFENFQDVEILLERLKSVFSSNLILFEDFNFSEFSDFYNKVLKIQQSRNLFGDKCNWEFDINIMSNILDFDNHTGLIKYNKGKHILTSKPGKLLNMTDSSKVDAIGTIINAFQIKEEFSFQEKRGKNSHKLFNTGLYKKDRGTYNLSTECMGQTDSQYFFDIITENPNQISVFYSFRKSVPSKQNVSGFTILFNVEGVIYYDKIYGYDKTDAILIELECQKMGWKNIYDQNYFFRDEYIPKEKLVIQLEKWKFDHYPYFDSLRFLDLKSGKLYNYRKNQKNVKLNSTEGMLYVEERDEYMRYDELPLKYVNL